MSTRTLFGTDGIRGKAGEYPLTGDMAFQIGRAITYYFSKDCGRPPKIIIGKDTRRSCYMLELAMASGVCAQGGNAIQTGPIPTPGVSFLTNSMRATAGVMISASHNPYYDNGFKIFDSTGKKLSDERELDIENLILNPHQIPALTGEKLGRAQRLDEVHGRYINHIKNTFPHDMNLNGIKIICDAANGAGYNTAPSVFEELGAEVVALAVSPNGLNINDNCGALHPQAAAELVIKEKADLGFCLDGDGDRLVVCDEKGQVLAGDLLVGLIARYLHDKGTLKKGQEVVGTVMSNLGLENYLKTLGIPLHRTNVGDRYISEYLNLKGLPLGAEPSGHIILSEQGFTGDGITAALKVIELVKFYGKKLSQLSQSFQLYPQLTQSVNVRKKIEFGKVAPVQNELKAVEKELGDRGRVLLRYSGTEPKARVMVEGEDQKVVEQMCSRLSQAVQKELGV